MNSVLTIFVSAREIEERYLSPQVVTLSRGGKFASGKAILLELGGEHITRRMSLWARLA